MVSSTNAKVMGTRSIAPDGLCVANRATRACATRSSRLRFLWEPQHALADDVALDLGGAAPDGLGPREEERGLQDRHGIVGAAVAPAVARDELLFVGHVAGQHLRIRTEDVHREVHRVAMRLRP